MRKNMFVGGIILLLAASTSSGASHDQGDLYRSSELSLDVFGSASAGEYTIDNWSGSQVRHNARLGAGVGLNYFITRNIGIGVDAYAEDIRRSLVDSASASMILRLPLGESGFAPYGFAGGGRQFDLAEAWFAQIGGGIEFRFTPRLGVFVDARWALPHETKHYGLARAGLRISF